MLRVRHCTGAADESVANCIGVGEWLLEPFVRLFHERVLVRGGAGQNSWIDWRFWDAAKDSTRRASMWNDLRSALNSPVVLGKPKVRRRERHMLKTLMYSL